MLATGPQLENGYCKIANELLEALARHRIPGEQMQCLFHIIRKTYGFNRLEDTISNSQFVKNTGLKKGNVSRALSSLVEKNIVIKNDNKRIPSYRFNKKYRTWKVLSKKQPVIKKATSVIKSDNSLLEERQFTKDNLQKTPPKVRKRLPDDFVLTESLKKYALDNRIDPKSVDELFKRFQDYHIGHGTKMLDWNRAWYTFVKNAPQFSPWALSQGEDDAIRKFRERIKQDPSILQGAVE